MRAACLFMLVVGCNSPRDHYPVNPGGGGGPPGLLGGARDPNNGGGDDDDDDIDAPALLIDGPTDVVGRVCLVADLRVPRAGCDPLDAGAINVGLRGMISSTSITNMSGDFAIGVPTNPTVYVVDRKGLRSFTSLFTGDAQIVPIFDDAAYEALATANGLSPAGGAALIEIRAGVVPLAGATVTLGGTTPRYDGADPNMWDTTSTGANGVAWIAQLGVGALHTITVNPNNGMPTKQVILEGFDLHVSHAVVTF